MNQTEDEFVRMWRLHLIGLGVCGSFSDKLEGPIKRAATISEIPGDVDALLRRMYSLLKPKPQPAPNGALPVKGVRP